jgi:hypothetical protein
VILSANYPDAVFAPYPYRYSARLNIAIGTFRHHAPRRFGLSIRDPTEVAMKKIIEASQRMSKIDRQGEEDE